MTTIRSMGAWQKDNSSRKTDHSTGGPEGFPVDTQPRRIRSCGSYSFALRNCWRYHWRNHLCNRLRLCNRRNDRFFYPGRYRCYHPIAQPRDRCYISRLLRVVAEQTPERRHGLIDRVRRYRDPRPDLIEQIVDTHYFTGVLGQTQEKAHRPGFKSGALSIS